MATKKRKKLSPKQIKFFGTKRQKAALKAKRSKSAGKVKKTTKKKSTKKKTTKKTSSVVPAIVAGAAGLALGGLAGANVDKLKAAISGIPLIGSQLANFLGITSPAQAAAVQAPAVVTGYAPVIAPPVAINSPVPANEFTKQMLNGTLAQASEELPATQFGYDQSGALVNPDGSLVSANKNSFGGVGGSYDEFGVYYPNVG